MKARLRGKYTPKRCLQLFVVIGLDNRLLLQAGVDCTPLSLGIFGQTVFDLFRLARETLFKDLELSLVNDWKHSRVSHYF